MKTNMFVIAIALIALLVSCGNQEVAQTAAPVETEAAVETVSLQDLVVEYFAELPNTGSHIINENDFVAAAIAGEEMTVIDIRRAEDFAAGHIAGAVNLPWGSSALVDQLANIPQEGNIYLHCYSGQTAGQAVALMNFAGIPVRSIRYGFNFGISKVEGYEAIMGEEVGTLGAANEIAQPVMDAYAGYYAEMAEAAGTPFASNLVSVDNALAIWEAQDPSVQFVSIRRPDDFAANHIEGAINVPFGATMPELFASLPADKKLIIYCYSGQTAGQTIAALRVLGYDAVSLAGGMGTPANAPLGWMNAGHPVVASN